MRDSDVKREIECMIQHRSNTNNPIDFPISPANMRARCEALITAMVGRDLVDQWWNSPNKAFCGDTPEQIYSSNVQHAYDVKNFQNYMTKDIRHTDDVLPTVRPFFY